MARLHLKSRIYEFQTLQGTHQFRFVQINPVKDQNEPLTATIVTKPLEGTDFEALSYTWGSKKLTKYLHTSSGDVAITENLESALKQLRHSESTRLLWVDAICIDQQNDLEKSTQVALMGDIYKSATRVLVWLGSLSLHTLWSLEYLEVLAQERDHFRNPNSTDWIQDPTLEKEEDGLNILESAVIVKVEALYDRPWFTRLWSIQECILASHVTLCCGPFQLDWNDFAMATALIIAALDNVGGYPQSFLPVLRVWRLIELRNKHHPQPGQKIDLSSDRLPYSVIANDFKSQECCDDKDRVFGLLALAKMDKEFKPDYTKTVAQIYTDFALASGRNTVLFNAGLCRRHPISTKERLRVDSETQQIFANLEYLPSWVADLRPRGHNEWKPIFGDVYNTTTSEGGRAFTSPDCPQMYFMHGLRFDYIATWIGITGDDFNPTQNATSFFYMISALDGFYKPLLESKYPNGQKMAEVWPMALATAVPLEDPHPLENYLGDEVTDEGLDILWDTYLAFAISPRGEIHKQISSLQTENIPSTFIETLSSPAQHVWRYHLYLAEVLRHHMIIRTKNGYVGLAPPGIEKGDAIVVFGGMKCPYVVRSVFEDESVALVMGPCYLQGIMEGEIYEDGLRENHEWVELDSGVPVPSGLIGLV